MNDSELQEYQPDEEPFEITARQLALKSYLEKKVPGLGSIYYGVLFALSQRRNPESITQAAHSCRELIKQLRRAFPGVPKEASQGQAHGKLGELSSFYKANPTDRELRDKVKELDEYYEQTQISRRQRYERLIEQANQGGQPNQEDKRNAAKALLEYEDWLSSIAHRGRDDITENEFRERLQGFEHILEVLIAEYYAVENQVQKLIEKPDPDESDIEELKRLLLKSALSEYFFRNLQNCKWLPLLKAEGYFTTPIDIITHEDGAISCPSWPQSSLLSRCVESHPELVSDMIVNVEATSNARVHQELVEIALKLPTSLVIEFANKSKDWIQDRYHTITLLPIRLAELAAKLASEGEQSVALDMADTLLDVTIDEEKYEKQTKTLGFSLAPEAEAYVDDWNYEKLLETLETSIDVRSSRDYVRLLCNKLSKAIRIEHKIRGDDKAETDYTYIARPAIEDHEQNSGTDRLKDHLITHIRDTIVELVQKGTPVDEVICLLREFTYPVFQRLEIHLLAEFPNQSKKHIESLLEDKANFNKVPIHHEFHRLLERAFGYASSDVQQGYLDWITVGPDTEQYKAMIRGETGKEPLQEQVEAYIARWKLRKYNPIKAYLNEEHEVEFKKLQSDQKIEDHPEFVSYRTSWVGPTSPIDDTELGGRSVLEVIAYLKKWEPQKGHFEPSPEGLGRFFRDDVKNRALEYSQIVDHIEPKDMRPVYLYYLFSGLEDSLKDNKEIDWSRIVALAENIVFDEHLPEPDKTQDDLETGWQGVRKEIASLISEGLKSADRIPFHLREKIWQLIERLCGDNDPTLEFEAEYGGSNMSPVDMSINTARGEAVHGLFHYLIWVDQNVNKDRAKENQEHSIPSEAVPILERILDIEREPTLTIRSVVGWYIQWLAFLDLDYTKEQLDRIIPREPELRRFRDAALEGYFSFNLRDGFLFKNLRSFFVCAFDWSNESESGKEFHRPKEHYVEHLAVYYWWGLDDLGGEHCLIKRVFLEGNVTLRCHAIEFIGRSLKTLLPVVQGGPEALKRLQELLEWRLETISKSEIATSEKREELKKFGWWFTYAQMDKHWLLNRLFDVLSITDGRIEWTHEVLKRLREFVSIDPATTAKSVDMIVQADSQPWNIEYWQEHLYSLFADIKDNGNHEAWDVCKSTINFLGERGYRSFGELL